MAQEAVAAKGQVRNKQWLWLLVLHWIGVVWVPFYNKIEPVLWGFPFFYWYQLLWVVIGALGFDTTGFVGDLPLIIAFAILAAYTYTSGLRVPAMIAVVKDVLIYITIIAAMIIIPAQLGGFGAIFSHVDPAKILLKTPDASSLNGYSAYATLAVGSALALFLYPHSVTAVLSSKSGNTIRRNMALLPAYSLVLGLLALLGYMALASSVKDMPEFAPYFKAYGSNFAVPALFLHFFPSWFVGVAFAAIGIGALVPVAIMSIAAANLYMRNVHKEFVNTNMTPEQETNVAKLVSLLVKVGAVVFILVLPLTYAIQLQLLGRIWIIQTLPALVFGLYTRVLDHRRGLLLSAGLPDGDVDGGVAETGELHLHDPPVRLCDLRLRRGLGAGCEPGGIDRGEYPGARDRSEAFA
ncbi:MAG: Na+/solute symporter [uncultured Caballeronia sp.]|nr:MAG: Na+/solute symporter [uncultured Caballeronia sp.]